MCLHQVGLFAVANVDGTKSCRAISSVNVNVRQQQCQTRMSEYTCYTQSSVVWMYVVLIKTGTGTKYKTTFISVCRMLHIHRVREATRQLKVQSNGKSTRFTLCIWCQSSTHIFGVKSVHKRLVPIERYENWHTHASSFEIIYKHKPAQCTHTPLLNLT